MLNSIEQVNTFENKILLAYQVSIIHYILKQEPTEKINMRMILMRRQDYIPKSVALFHTSRNGTENKKHNQFLVDTIHEK